LEHLLGRAGLKALACHAERPRILTLCAAQLDLPAAAAPAQVPSAQPSALGSQDLRQAVDDFQRQQIALALTRNQGNWAATARELGLDRANLLRLASRLGLKAGKA
ncbi:MAG TPA: helix-turn-helix domain-containing protein, partial [Pseudomonas sp.]|nr:helix-turn-helix domain-containing protein [Pseudomonas sp.]